jgi:P-loop containing dynein motor region/Hydrolytic ATP binding site of dynein motor region/P-loop containing dynein motor region D4
LVGPSGTGKTETVKELAGVLGTFSIGVGFGTGMTNKGFMRLVKAIVSEGRGSNQSGDSNGGIWGCFDEFNRLPTEILTSAAQILSEIRMTILRTKTSFASAKFKKHIRGTKN